jgi:hypothetical protein
MAKPELRISFKNAPASVLKQLFGEAKHAQLIIDAITKFEGQAHTHEIFHYLNTDDDSDWLATIQVPMQNLLKQLSTMVATGQIKRLGERSSRYALMTYEGVAPEGEDEDDNEVETAE